MRESDLIGSDGQDFLGQWDGYNNNVIVQSEGRTQALFILGIRMFE